MSYVPSIFNIFALQAMEGDGGGWNCLMDESEEMIDTFEWTDEEKDLVGPSVNLIKAAKVSEA